MEYHIFQESTRWREARDKRMIDFVRFSAYLMIIGGSICTAVIFFQQLYSISLLLIAMVASSVYVLYLIKKNSISLARNMISISATSYFLIVCIFFDGPDNINKQQGTV